MWLFGIAVLLGACSADLGVAAGPSGDAGGELYPRPVTATDVSGEYAAFVADGRLNAAAVDAAFEAIRGELEGVRVVIVPSYLVDFIAAGRRMGLIDYFSDQQAWLKSIGVGTLLAPVNTEASVPQNGARLAAFIANSHDPLCIISHSKGGLDTLDALLRLTPEQRRSVRCWIALQAPFAGSPIADIAADSGLGRVMIDLTLSLVGGSPRSLDNMTTVARRAYLDAADADIRRVAEAVPILSVTSVLGAPARPADATPFEWPRQLMAEHGIMSDGMVPTGSAILPYARFVVIDNLDHGDTVDADCAPRCSVDNDVTLLKALFAIALGASAAPVGGDRVDGNRESPAADPIGVIRLPPPVAPGRE